MQNQYNIANHTILPLIYRILCPSNYITYLLKDPITKSLFLFNPLIKLKSDLAIQTKYHSWLIEHIRNIQKISEAKLSHIVCNHGVMAEQYNRFMEKLPSSLHGNSNRVKLLAPNQNNNNIIKSQVIGQISICFIGASGYTPDYNLVGVTHISPTSTKVPVLFVHQLLGVCCVDYGDQQGPQVSADGYLKSLEKVKYFPNQTFIFPNQTLSQIDLLFAKAVIDSEPTSKATMILNQKLKIFENNKNMPDCLIPTTVYQQKLINPFLYPQKYAKLLGVKNSQRAKAFNLLRAMRKQWKS